MKITVALELGGRTVVEQLMTAEDYRGDFRQAVVECVGRVELSTFGPGNDQGSIFDTQLQMKPQTP